MPLVIAAFSTPRRRFLPGMKIEHADLDGPLGLADWQRLGFIETDPTPAKSKPAAAGKSE